MEQLFCKLWFAGLACSGLQMCCFVGGVSSYFVRGRKNKINSLQTALPYQRSTNPVNPFFNFSIPFQCVESFLYTCIQRLTICGGRDFEAPTYQTVTILSKCTELKFTHDPRLTYIACYHALIIPIYQVYNYFSHRVFFIWLTYGYH